MPKTKTPAIAVCGALQEQGQMQKHRQPKWQIGQIEDTD
ncbi:hypothetical protein Z948_2455 [Sulfitobacter donghicola DSW-25 = KCTC 12864 = JCM 14565]|uniref:Uncharacterized protein n=1 Tax=Sulfitobacter donghicola DSW-25 = KCTC 12864 = JCM 14565 TaxID=1300350 RepID=A0A073IRU6_9RHOB|nr:hypothetical protein DSW25_17465 [Sulfitobacter donghicola DSW-25 = KCTC 12864 = JCM 14565]KIN68724.1 hypothetical protein Z948_2455 [Sulfitobacter donghicola DSW-25 = KCTC 12864 = JCM 14565]